MGSYSWPLNFTYEGDNVNSQILHLDIVDPNNAKTYHPMNVLDLINIWYSDPLNNTLG